MDSSDENVIAEPVDESSVSERLEVVSNANPRSSEMQEFDFEDTNSVYEYSTEEDDSEIVNSSARVVPSNTRYVDSSASSGTDTTSSIPTSSSSSSQLSLSSIAQRVRQRRGVRSLGATGSNILEEDVDDDDIEVSVESVEIIQIDSEDEAVEQNNMSESDNVMGSNEDNNGGTRASIIVALSEVSEANVNANDDSTESDNDQDEEDGDEGPARKIPRLETSAADDEEGFICQICYEPFTNSGGHRVCCLKCGHVYGKECIERWIQSSKRCPSCNCKAMKKDIRIIYVKNLKAADTAELERLKEELQKVLIEKNKADLCYQTLKQREIVTKNEILRLQKENGELKSKLSGINREEDAPGPSTRLNCESHHLASTSAPISMKFPRLSPIKHFEIKEGQCRVGAYNEWMNMFVVSHSIKSALFPGGSFGIKKINSLEWKVFQSFPIHQKPLRDMAFNSTHPELLLTVGLDKKAVLFNTSNNVAVQTFNTDYPLWSCCWNGLDQQIFYVGASNGQVTSYDIRSPREPLGTLSLPTNDRSSVARLKFVPPAYQNQSFNMSGLLIKKINSVWFGEMIGTNQADTRYYQLPVEGPFSNIDFEPNTRQVLVSCRPKQIPGEMRKQGSNHLICDLKKTYVEEEGRDIFSCDVVQSITSGTQEYATLCRSALVACQEKKVYLAANGETNKIVRIWDVGNAEYKSMIRIADDLAMDFVSGRSNDRNFIGIVSDKSTDIYEIK